MRQRLFTFLSAVSLLLFVAAVVLWVRSYLPERMWFRWTDGRLVVVGAEGFLAHRLGETYLDPPPQGVYGVGELLASLRRGSAPFMKNSAPGRGLFGAGPPPPGASASLRLMGVEVFSARHSAGGPVQYRVVAVPAAYLALPAAILPTICLVRHLTGRRRTRVGLCRRCGYDLRASKDRCPECGTAIERASA